MHTLVTDGVLTADGTFLSLLEPDLAAVTELFRRPLLAVLVDPKVVDAILHHLEVADQPTSVHARDPPAA